MRNISHKSCRENQNTHFVLNNFFFGKSCYLWDNIKKILHSRACHRWKYDASALHTGYLRLQSQTQNMQ